MSKTREPWPEHAQPRELALADLTADLAEARLDDDTAVEHVFAAASHRLRSGLVAAPHVIYIGRGTRFVPLEARRLAPWPGFARQGQLAAALLVRSAPVMTVGSSAARRLLARIDPQERHGLAAMGVIALIPFVACGRLVAFLCVGGCCGTLDPAWLARVALPFEVCLHRTIFASGNRVRPDVTPASYAGCAPG